MNGCACAADVGPRNCTTTSHRADAYRYKVDCVIAQTGAATRSRGRADKRPLNGCVCAARVGPRNCSATSIKRIRVRYNVGCVIAQTAAATRPRERGDVAASPIRSGADQRQVRKSLTTLRGRASLLSKPTVPSVGKEAWARRCDLNPARMLRAAPGASTGVLGVELERTFPSRGCQPMRPV